MTSVVFGVLISCLLIHLGSAYFLDPNCPIDPDHNSVSPFPWMALVMLPDKNCSGTLIYKNFVITSANCVFNQSQIKVLLGEFNRKLKKNTFEFPIKEILVRSVYTPSHYNENNYKNDIALLQLTENVLYEAHIRPICIWLIGFYIDTGKQNFTTPLWYLTKKWTFPFPKRTLFSKLELDLCEHSLGINPDKSQICAGHEVKLCVEAGSPLVQKITFNNRSRHALVGIQSYGVSNTCLYTNIESYLEWIVGIVLKVEIIVNNIF
uniref:Vitamin K-dependent protein C-like n=1 Tax=Drosophila rhopaloa TaxID=1041015 RepID=A0A6P4FC21_DRORH